MKINRFLLTSAILAMLCVGTTQASFTTYTNEAAFLTAIAGMDQQTLNFDSYADEYEIASGVPEGEITFTYDIADETMMVVNTYGTTSVENSLGLTGGDDVFLDGDIFSLAFGDSINALGMYFITSDEALEEEIGLFTDLGIAYNSSDYTEVSGGGMAYFVGLVSSDSQFTAASVGFADSHVNFVYNVDDIHHHSGCS